MFFLKFLVKVKRKISVFFEKTKKELLFISLLESVLKFNQKTNKCKKFPRFIS